MTLKRYSLEMIFKIWFLGYTMLSVCNFTYGKPIISYVMWPMFLFGAVLLLVRLFNMKQYLHMPGVVLLAGMDISLLLSTVMNREYGVKDNVVTFVLWCFYFFMLYTMSYDHDSKDVEKEFKILGFLYALSVSVGNIISIMMMLVGYSHVYTNERGYEVAAGFIWGRLWGIYIDPNFASVMSVAAICFALYIWKTASRKTKVCLAFSMIINICFIAFSDSRTGRVCLGVMVITYGLLWLFYRKKDLAWTKKMVNIVVIIGLGIGAFYLPKAVSNSYNSMWRLVSYVDQVKEEILDDSLGETNQDNHSLVSEKYQQKVIDRGYDIENDISNRRFDIWKSGIELFSTSPVYGTSFGGLRSYAEENLPETYIVNNDYKPFNTLDNEVLNVFVGQGLIGIILLAAFVILVLVKVFRNIFKLNEHDFRIASTCFIIAICITASGMFRAAMFYHSSPNANMFWTFLGILVFYMHKKGCEIKNEK